MYTRESARARTHTHLQLASTWSAILWRPLELCTQNRNGRWSWRVFIQYSDSDNHTFFPSFSVALRYIYLPRLSSSRVRVTGEIHAHYQSCRVITCINRTLPIVSSFPPPASGTLPTFESNLPPALRLPSTLLPLLRALNRQNYLHA